jgi:hypothetical protein
LLLRPATAKNYTYCNVNNQTELAAAQAAYSSYLQRAVLESAPAGEDDGPSYCLQPCRASLLKLSTFAEDFYSLSLEKVLVLRMPTIIQLTESRFSYGFMDFASEFGGILNI